MTDAFTQHGSGDGGADAGPVTGPVGGPVFAVSVQHEGRVNFAMHQRGVPLVSMVEVLNTSAGAADDVTVTLSLENADADPVVLRVDRLGPGEPLRVAGEGPRLRGDRLAQRSEAERTALRVHVSWRASAGAGGAGEMAGAAGAAGARSEQAASFPLVVLPHDHWPGAGYHPELTAAFVTPNHERIAGLLRDARAHLGRLSGRDALDGYQSASRQRAAQIAEACFGALRGWDVGYVNPPASFETEGQRVRLVDRVWRERLGTCLDLSLLLAGVWEQAGLHPLVLLPEGHALAGVWTRGTSARDAVLDDAAQVRNLVALGDVVPVESTVLTRRGGTFAAAVEAGRACLASAGGSFLAVDVVGARRRGVRPLPLALEGDGAGGAGVAGGGGARPAGVDGGKTSSRGVTELPEVALADRAAGGATGGAAGGASVQGSSATGVDESPHERALRWQNRLLDLSLRNRLINFRATGRTIRLLVPDVARLEDLLAGESRVVVVPRSEGDDAVRVAELESGRVASAEGPAETSRRLLALFRTSKAATEETGSNPLHLALGMLRWYEADASEAPRFAPLVLLPVRLYRIAAGGGYRYEIGLSEEPLRPNVTLLEKLRSEYGVDTRGLDDLPEDDSGLDLPLIFRRFRAAVVGARRWEIEESAHLGLFSFTKFLMWRDLKENEARLSGAGLVARLLRRGGADDGGPLPDAAAMDDAAPPGELLCTRDADSSQLAAVQASAQGRTFVLEGPPGTGKSQTITNIIAHAVASGRRVLFVAEKLAALTVVRARLERDGLGPFCLELHSAKASKKEVMAQIEARLALVPPGPEMDWSATVRSLRDAQARLNGYAAALHGPRRSGESLHAVLGRLARARSSAGAVALPDLPAAGATAEQLATWREVAASLGRAAAAVGGPSRHALRGLGVSRWSFELPGAAARAIGQAEAAALALGTALGRFAEACGAAGVRMLREEASVGHAVALAAALLEAVVADGSLLLGPGAGASRGFARRAVELGEAACRLRDELLGRYEPEWLEMDHLEAAARLRSAAGLPWPIGAVATALARGRLKKYARGAALPATDVVLADLERARERRGVVAELAAHVAGRAEAGWLPPRGADAPREAWAGAAASVAWAERVAGAAMGVGRDAAGVGVAERLVAVACDGAVREAAAGAARAVVDASAAWGSAWAALNGLLGPAALGGDAGEPGAGPGPGPGAEWAWTDRVGACLRRWSGGLDGLNAWCVWRGACEAAGAQGLGPLVAALERGELAAEGVSEAFERAFGEPWFNANADADPVIRGFNAERHNADVAAFRELDRAAIGGASGVIASRVAGAGAGVAEAELALIRREVQKKRRHLPTRRLIASTTQALPVLKPCFLMSPLSVAQYLDPSLPPFDLVIFDEASQIPVWDAVGAMVRGRSVIVVGDARQLPPTRFFSIGEGEGDEEIEDGPGEIDEDMESILDECNAAGVPSLRLRWHYRSRHETLIAFSNRHYYNDDLQTFPSPQERSEELGVTLRHVADGVYDRGGDRTNAVEARRVVEDVVERLRAHGGRESVGIVTFNIAQRALIEDLLDEKRREHPEIEPYFTAAVEEPVFVKNLENVQGDERDAIVFSVGYGPDASGTFGMNFGPLNQQGGERRLNVAVTRARRRLVVFSSLRAEQIDLRRTDAVGVRHFRAFLEYAERGPGALAHTGETLRRGAAAFDLEHAVRDALVERGWAVDTRIGCAGYRIDLGVRHPRRPGEYVLGIECDGASYRAAATARDRDRLRGEVLAGLGWRMARVWSIEWRLHQRGCVERLEAAIRAGLGEGEGEVESGVGA